jgi:hypothetical protein
MNGMLPTAHSMTHITDWHFTLQGSKFRRARACSPVAQGGQCKKAHRGSFIEASGGEAGTMDVSWIQPAALCDHFQRGGHPWVFVSSSQHTLNTHALCIRLVIPGTWGMAVCYLSNTVSQPGWQLRLEVTKKTRNEFEARNCVK